MEIELQLDNQTMNLDVISMDQFKDMYHLSICKMLHNCKLK